ncbi:hypothetical protein ONZ45_g6517 [Pleurotus djamor]|nr:hypothetical protein ONZ45_g6517 [Pleurotus djamor]
MTTRVNKRGTIFKPVAKAKSRGPSLPRQPSVPSDSNPNPNAGPSVHDFSFQTAPSSSRDMPPPSSLPSDMSSSGHFSVLTFSSPVLPPTTPTTVPRPPQPRPLATPQPPPPRTPSVPPLIASATPRKPTVITPSAPPTVAVVPPVISSHAASAFAIGESSTLGPSPSSTTPISARVDQPTDPSILLSQPVETTQSDASVDSSSNQQPESLSENQPSHPKRKTTRRSTTPQQDTPSQAPQHPKRRKRNPPSDGDAATPTTNTRRRRATSPNLPKFNPEDGPGEELDPTTITMAALCSDTGQGRISSKAVEIQDNFVSWKSQSRQQRARMRELAELKKYGKITEDGEGDVPLSGNAAGGLSNAPAPNESQSLAGADSGDEENNNEFDYSDNLPSNRFNVQVRIGPNGETIIDEESLVIDRDQDVDTSEYTHVVESDTSKFVNSGTYRKKCRGSRWSKEETELFYHALSQYGENYELLAFVLPGRDRTACKNKFKAEDKRNSARITYCLNNRIPVDISTLSRMTGKDFTGPCPEIRTPAPKAPPVALAPTTDAATSQKPSVKVKKRSRSRSMALNDDVQIIGSADTFVQEDD